jgi:hypothetical protein
MSLSSLKAALGVGFQSGQGHAADDADMTYIPVLNANVAPEQLAQNLPPEVGGAYFSRGAYKAGVRSRGDLALIPRAQSVGLLLRSLFHLEQVAPSGNMTSHRFTPGDSTASAPKWLTLRRMVGNYWGEQMIDARIGSFRIDVAAANVANVSVQLLGGGFHEIPGAEVFVPDEPFFITCSADVIDGNGTTVIVDRLSIEIGVQLTDNEFRVGSYFLDDITQLQRMAQITADVRIKSRDWFSRVFRNGAAAPGAGAQGAWDPVLYRAGLYLTLRSNEVVPQLLRLNFAALDYLTLPVQVTGAELVRAQLTATVTLDADNYDLASETGGALQPVEVVLINNRTTAYA